MNDHATKTLLSKVYNDPVHPNLQHKINNLHGSFVLANARVCKYTIRHKLTRTA